MIVKEGDCVIIFLISLEVEYFVVLISKNIVESLVWKRYLSCEKFMRYFMNFIIEEFFIFLFGV